MRPGLRNSEGERVDPIPFLVATSTAFLVTFSFGPVYCLSLGLPLEVGLLACTLVFVGLTLAAHHRLVRQDRPALRGEVPPALRIRQLFYVALVATGVLLLLTLPFLVP
ncbi:hypothetical protein [Halomarina litorea]|uniref:hypothetical protein n=1 Tax=Halomarina litorea TaxID=2961595 RepID=UPI0020C43C5E|nr:hypothetical protein [Halomarina sp. BCD28]